MIIFINNGKPFESAAITRTLYYATALKNVDLYITGIKNLISFARYSRTPVEVIRKKIKFYAPKELKEPVYILDPKAKTSIRDVNKIGTLVVDFTNSINEYPKIKSLGLGLLHYEAVAAAYELFIRRKKEETILNFNQEITKDLIYFARKIIEGITYLDCFPLVSPRLIVFGLRHIYKKYNLLVDSEKISLNIDPIENSVKLSIVMNVYDKNLRKIDEKEITLENDILMIYLPHNDEIKEFRLLIDYDRRRVYLSKNFFVEDKSLEEIPFNTLFLD